MGISISFELPVLRLIGEKNVFFKPDLMHDFKYWVLAWLTPKSSFGWPVADTKGTPSCSLPRRAPSQYLLRLYQYTLYTNTYNYSYYIIYCIWNLHYTGRCQLYRLYHCYHHPGSCTLNINCTKEMQMHFVYVDGDMHYMKWGDKIVDNSLVYFDMVG